MITVEQALGHVFALTPVMPVETVPLTRAAGRVLARTVQARRNQPPFAASAMDGYAVKADEIRVGAQFAVIGESAAGHGFSGIVKPGHAVRIFTGAPVPDGANYVIIQEDVARSGDQITLSNGHDTNPYIRAAGADFSADSTVNAPLKLGPAEIALLAAMNIAEVPVYRRPVVALIATGDELVMPGENPARDQIIASNSLGLSAMFAAAGADTRMLPIARDTVSSLANCFDLAGDADLIVTIGGASVGDHDLVAQVAETQGMERAFYKIAMRPGKPLMAGRMGRSLMIGLPGNPVSSMVCGRIFVQPMIDAMLGQGPRAALRQIAPLAIDIPANGPREHYMRATLKDGQITPLDRQDSALLSVLALADALLIRPVKDPARSAGEPVEFILL